MKSHYPGCELDDRCTCQDHDNEEDLREESEFNATSDTPETDAAYFKDGATMYDLAGLTKKLERERNDARDLCRWAIPRLRSICHDFDVSNTGWACAKQMENHPEIFPQSIKTEGKP